MKGKAFTYRYAPRKISPLGGLAALLARNDKVCLYFQRPVRLRGKTGPPKIAVKRDFREPYKMRAEGSMKIKPSLSSRASVEGSCLEQRAVPNTAKEFVFRYAPRKISPLGQSLLLLSSVEMTGRRDGSTARLISIRRSG